MDRDWLDTVGAGAGFAEGPLEKVIRLGDVAALVSRHPLLSRVLALKGGTAINLFHGPPRRLSVDLDFNYVGAVDRQAMLNERPDVERAVEAVSRELSYRAQWSREEHAGRKIFLNYTAASGAADRIEVDLNFAHRLPLTPLRMAEMWQPADLRRPEVQLCGIPEIAAGKVCALLDRCKPRDLFDVARLPQLVGPSWRDRSFKVLIVAFTGILDHPLHTYRRARLERVREADIAAELRPMLGGRVVVDREALLDQAWQAVGPIVTLDDAEREFVDRLQVGELRLDLLNCEDLDLRARLEVWPPLQWKATSARRARPPRPAGSESS